MTVSYPDMRRSDLAIGLVAVAVLAVFFFLHRVGNSDLFWQIKTGELISITRTIIRADSFSFTAVGNPWINHEWMAELAFYFADGVGGFVALSVLSLTVGLILGLLLFLGISQLARSPTFGLLLTLVVFALGAPRFQQLRPELFSYLFFGAYLSVLSTAKDLRARNLWILVPVQLLWANMHASAAIGPALLLTFGVVASFLGCGGRTLSRAEKRDVLVIGVLCLIATTINPFWFHIYTFPFEHLSHRFTLAVTSDWRAPVWLHGGADLAPWGQAALAIACILALAKKGKEIHWPLVAIAAASLVPGVMMLRFVPYSAMALAFLLASSLPVPKLVASGWRISAARITALVLCLGLPALMFSVGPIYGLRFDNSRIELVLGRPMGAGLDAKQFPVGAISFLKSMPWPENIFNDMAYGGYLIYRLWPQNRVFFDTRTPVYGEAFYEDYVSSLFDRKKFEEVVNRYGINTVLYDVRQINAPGGPLQFLLRHPHWVTVFRSKNAIILTRRGG